MSAEARCPVCGRPAGLPGTQAGCGECGWPLNTRLRAGTLTAKMRQEFGARLQHARQDQAERDERTLKTALGDVIAAVRPDREATVIEVGPDRIEMVTGYLDTMGSPRVRDGWAVDWMSVLPELPAGERARHARLTDGVAGLGDDRIAVLVRDRLPPWRGDGALVVCRPAGARVLEAAAEAITRATRPSSRLLHVAGPNGMPVRSMLAEAAAKAPLRRPYYLLTAAVDPRTGDVRLRPRQLFAVGAAPGTKESLTLRRMPGDVSDMTLAIFAGNGQVNWSKATPLAMYQVPVPAGPEPTIQAVLGGPGRIRITEPAQEVAPEAWAQVYRRIPARVTTTTSPVDLVCAIDLAGSVEAVLKRKGLARDLIELLGGEYPDPQSLRVAIVTCTDHVFGRGRGKENQVVTDRSELGSAAEALAWLSTAEGVNPKDFHCTPVEDLLHESLNLLTPRRRPRLVTLAGRPPHSYPQRADGTMACPLKFDWRLIVGELDGLGARYAVVVDELPPGRAPERADWNRLGPAGQYRLATATARQLAEDLGLLAGQNQRIPLPLADGQ
jgi:hypothetical protein